MLLVFHGSSDLNHVKISGRMSCRLTSRRRQSLLDKNWKAHNMWLACCLCIGFHIFLLNKILRQGSGDRAMVSSSIALLQERFRQLQRVKERREEKELLKLFSESETISPAMLLEPGRLLPGSGQAETVRPCRQPLNLNQDFLSLGPNSNPKIKYADSRTTKKKATPWSSSIWPVESNLVSTSSSFESFDSSDVDTSLHL